MGVIAASADNAASVIQLPYRPRQLPEPGQTDSLLGQTAAQGKADALCGNVQSAADSPLKGVQNVTLPLHR